MNVLDNIGYCLVAQLEIWMMGQKVQEANEDHLVVLQMDLYAADQIVRGVHFGCHAHSRFGMLRILC